MRGLLNKGMHASVAVIVAATMAFTPVAAQETHLRMTVLGGPGAGDGTVGAIKAWNAANPLRHLHPQIV